MTKVERERRAKAKEELEKLLAEKGLWCIPTCKVCKKTPDKIDEYKYQDNPVKYVIEHERLLNSGRNFYCTKCYVKAGMPLF